MRNKVMPAAWVVKLVCWPIRIASASGSFCSCQQLHIVPFIITRLSLALPVSNSSLVVFEASSSSCGPSVRLGQLGPFTAFCDWSW